MNAIIQSHELQQRMKEGAVVIDVMKPEDYEACHVAGAQNACIYELVFLQRVAELVADLNAELIIYDTTGTTRTAVVARDRLLDAGYRRVFILAGGLSAWCREGLPVQRGAEKQAVAENVPDGRYAIDIEKSRIEWIGRNLSNRHYGQLSISKGELIFEAGRPSSGSIIVDMHSLTNLDLQDPAYREMLISHLKSNDFFAVNRFPTASLTFSGWDMQDELFPEAPGGIAGGELTIRDISRSVRFPAIAAPQQDGSIKFQAAFDIDRTLWDVCYGSCKFFEHLGMHLVHDIISLELFVVANKD